MDDRGNKVTVTNESLWNDPGGDCYWVGGSSQGFPYSTKLNIFTIRVYDASKVILSVAKLQKKICCKKGPPNYYKWVYP